MTDGASASIDAAARGRSAAASGTAADARVLSVRGLAKRFGATVALQDASLELRAGEIHAIVGENGSGKSTLVKILAGVHRPDAGALELRAGRVEHLAPPRAALAKGIATVFQEVLVVEPRSILENVWLGADGLFRERVPAERKATRATELLTALLGDAPPLDLPVGALSLSGRQACCIARALARDPQVLILDEATSALDFATRDRLFVVLRELAARRVAVIFISHRMDEIDEIGDRITVMRSGRTVACLERGRFDKLELVRLMTGQEHLTPEHARARIKGHRLGPVALSARGIVLAPGAVPVDFDVRQGELVGVAGLEGHGQDRFLRILAGERPLAGTVTRRDDAREQTIESPDDAAALGIAYVPRERRGEALFESKSVRENFGIASLSLDTRGGLISPARTRKRLAEYQARLAIRFSNPEVPITHLSGGNQQKVVVARWLVTEPRVLVLNDPTRGVDLAAKRDLYELLAELSSNGLAVVMLSTELDEHVELMDRVIVFRENTVFDCLPGDRVTRQSLVAAFFGEMDAQWVA
jgi:ABC-type sugar transport system ATPase subunit